MPRYVLLADDIEKAMEYFLKYHPWNAEERHAIEDYRRMLTMNLLPNIFDADYNKK